MIKDLVYVIILAIIEGITEWLPISSTAHLLIASSFLEGLEVSDIVFNENYLNLFDVLIQLGAVMAVVVIYFKEFNPFKNLSLWIKIFISIIPIGVIGILFDDIILKYFYNIKAVGVVLIFYGIFYIIVSLIKKRNLKQISDITYKDILSVGVIGSLAIIPATSRSGITVSFMILLGYSNEASFKLSFLMAVPIIFLASIFKMYKFMIVETFIKEQIILLIIGMMLSFLISLLVIKILSKFVKRKNMIYFGFYRIILGAILLLK